MMNRIYSKIITILSFILVCQGVYAQEISPEAKLRYANRIIERYYVDSVDSNKIVEEAINAMLKTLDPHSTYTNAEETKELTEPLQGNFSGIGIQFQMLHDTLYVVQTIVGGPCERAGIVAGDRIISAGDSIISGVKKKNTDVMKILRGPKGSKVNLKVLRKGRSNPMDFRITRDDIPIYSVDASYIAAPGVGYIKLSRFSETSAQEVLDAVNKLKKLGANDFILDLEYNGGGYLQSACALAEMLLSPNDLIVFTKGDKVPYSEYRASSQNANTISGKIVVMVNQYSASASEILAGAVQDNDRGVIVGRRTFGKGLVQSPFKMPDGSMIRLTISRYYTPSGRSIQKPYEKGDRTDYDLDILNRYRHGELTNADSVVVDENNKFTTLHNRRAVYGGGGIVPDKFVALDTTATSDYSRELIAKGVLNSFATTYIDENRARLKKTFKTEESFLNGFQVDEAMLSRLVDYASKEGVEFKQEGYDQSLPTIKAMLKGLIGRDLFTQSTYYRVVNSLSDVYNEALRIILDQKEYNDLISPLKHE